MTLISNRTGTLQFVFFLVNMCYAEKFFMCICSLYIECNTSFTLLKGLSKNGVNCRKWFTIHHELREIEGP
jgi:hypothetical protein